jgi:hypothetical protein
MPAINSLLVASFHDWFNHQPYAPFAAAGMLALFGAFLLCEGRRGITRGVLRGAWGRVYTGKSARRNGYVFCGIGAVMVLYSVAAVVMKLL